MMQPLDPTSLPLSGIRLIEASAGTGKTYTLTLLYLRLIVELGLPVDAILVVTFTRAATDELRTRIRERLRHALTALRDPQHIDDPTLCSLVQKVDPATAHHRVRAALVRMDEATIFTIHGFCQRVLQDNAFETGTPFTPEFLENEEPIRRQIMEDFWRKRFYALPREMATWITATWNTPEEMLRALTPLLALSNARIIPEYSTEMLEPLADEHSRLYQEVRRLWLEQGRSVIELLEHDACLSRSAANYRHDRLAAMAAAMEQVVHDPHPPYLLRPEVALFQQQEIRNRCKKKCSPPEHPFFDLFEQFFSLHEQYIHHLRLTLLQEARSFMVAELEQRKTLQSLLFFDDLLSRLLQALTSAPHSRQLASQIARTYPAALVDEFQDTDPLQYGIFQNIYQEADQTLLCMIGDPKQAIYSFRGADIFTYIHARRRTPPGGRYTMTVNYRSCASIIRTLNHLFNHSNSFLFEPDISFHPVEPAPDAPDQPLVIHGAPVPPLTALLLACRDHATGKNRSSITKETGMQAAAVFTAEQIRHLLETARSGKAHLEDRPLAAGDIAVLVRTHDEAERVQQALRHQGIASVYYGRRSIFSTAEARQLFILLSALSNLTDTAGLRSALATDWFGLQAQELATLQDRPKQWDEYLNRLHTCLHLWKEQGVMPMLQHIIAREGMVQRLSSQHGGARKLTNYIHLMELLQQAPTARHGNTSLLRWFSSQLDKPGQEVESQQLRLEDDDNLVQIVTIHKAKGLEYPVVFLPYIWVGKKFHGNGPLVFHDRTNFDAVVDLGSGNEENLLLAEQEQRAEDMRLLYVALTRARCCCFFCWGALATMEQSSLGSLLHPQTTTALPDEEQIISQLERVNAEERRIAIHPSSFSSPAQKPLTDPQPPPVTLRQFHGTVRPGRLMTSYTQLTAEESGPATAAPPFPAESDHSPMPQPLPNPFTFPRGPSAGTCLHTILEDIDFTSPPESWAETIASELTVAGIATQWQAGVTRWLEKVLAVELPGACALNQVSSRKRINELSFLFPLEDIDLQHFNTVLGKAGIPALSGRTSIPRGMMKGFIDLVFVDCERYFIVDYKSNYLGPDPSFYERDALGPAMAEHRYDLQYLIYALALHRFLASRMKGYTYERNFGGIYYLFLRGMHPDYPPGNGIYYTRPKAAMIHELDSCCRGAGG